MLFDAALASEMAQKLLLRGHLCRRVLLPGAAPWPLVHSQHTTYVQISRISCVCYWLSLQMGWCASRDRCVRGGRTPSTTPCMRVAGGAKGAGAHPRTAFGGAHGGAPAGRRRSVHRGRARAGRHCLRTSARALQFFGLECVSRVSARAPVNALADSF